MADFFSTMPGASRNPIKRNQPQQQWGNKRGKRQPNRQGGRGRAAAVSMDDDDDTDDGRRGSAGDAAGYKASEVPSLSMGGVWVDWENHEGVEGRTASTERMAYLVLHLFLFANLIVSAIIAKYASDYVAQYQDPGQGPNDVTIEKQDTIKGTADLLKYFPGISIFICIFYLAISVYTSMKRIRSYPTISEDNFRNEGMGIKSLNIIKAEWALLFVHFVIYIVVAFVLYYGGANRANTDNGKGISLQSECNSNNNFFCDATKNMSNAAWVAAVFSFVCLATVSYIWYAHPGEAAPHYSMDLSLTFQRNAYYALALMWIAIASAGAAVCAYAGDYQQEYLKPGPQQRDILNLVKVTQGFSGTFLAAGGALYAVFLIFSTKRSTNEDNHEASAKDGIHSLNITWIEFFYAFINFVLITVFAIALAVGGWRAKRLNTNRGFAMYMSCADSDMYCQQTKNMGISMFVASGFLFPALVLICVILYKHPVRKALLRDGDPDDPESGGGSGNYNDEDDDDDAGNDPQSRAAGIVQRPRKARVRQDAYNDDVPGYTRAYSSRKNNNGRPGYGAPPNSSSRRANGGPPPAAQRNYRQAAQGLEWCRAPGCRQNCRRGAKYCRTHLAQR